MSTSGEARRVYDAALRSGWDNYRHITVKWEDEHIKRVSDGAVAAAHSGDVTRLADCLRGRKPLTKDDRIALLAYIEKKVPWRWPRWKWLADALNNQTDEDFEALAEFIEEIGRRRGRRRNEPVHEATRLAEVLMSVGLGGDAAVKMACEMIGKETGTPVPEEKVLDLLDRPKKRRR